MPTPLCWTFGLQRINFCCFNAQSQGYHVTAAAGGPPSRPSTPGPRPLRENSREELWGGVGAPGGKHRLLLTDCGGDPDAKPGLRSTDPANAPFQREATHNSGAASHGLEPVFSALTTALWCAPCSSLSLCEGRGWGTGPCHQQCDVSHRGAGMGCCRAHPNHAIIQQYVCVRVWASTVCRGVSGSRGQAPGTGQSVGGRIRLPDNTHVLLPRPCDLMWPRRCD